ncbi:MAG: glyoxalase [Flavobacteriaceae bacterium]|nr:MAG: glyoxalase [Flavobacteriaceae bacterium]
MVGYFEIPVNDMHRAKMFYETVFAIKVAVHDLGGLVMGWFPRDSEKKEASGSLVKHEMYATSETAGPLVYFSCQDVAIELSRVVDAGGKVLKQKTEIGGGQGFMGLLLDSEGNRIAVHSQT